MGIQGLSANAFALLGRHIGVNTGLLNVAQNQHQLAAVIDHEVAHVEASHANGRLSTTYATQTGLALVQVIAGTESVEKQQLLGLLGVGAQVGVLLPYSRSQESEADILGLEYIARAGFDPRQSIELWQNFPPPIRPTTRGLNSSTPICLGPYRSTSRLGHEVGALGAISIDRKDASG